MAVKLRIDGLEAMKATLRRLPEELRDEGRAIVGRHVDDAEATIRASYQAHRRSGNLEKGLYTNHKESGRFGVTTELRNRAPHAWLFEVGTELPREGGTGRMPAAKIFIPTVMKARRAMMADLIALVERHGLRVSGG